MENVTLKSKVERDKGVFTILCTDYCYTSRDILSECPGECSNQSSVTK